MSEVIRGFSFKMRLCRCRAVCLNKRAVESNSLASSEHTLNGNLRVRYVSFMGLKPHKAYKITGAPRVGEGSTAPVACPRETVMNPSVADTKRHNSLHEATDWVNGYHNNFLNITQLFELFFNVIRVYF